MSDDGAASYSHDFLRHSGLRSSKVSAAPKPSEIFLGYTRSGYTGEDAIAEYVDNALEQASRASRPEKRNVWVTTAHNGSNYVVRIEDEAGGCARESANLFIKPGGTSVGPRDEGISRFGIGGKASGLSIADQVIVQSHSSADAGFVAVLDKAAVLSKPDWEFDVFDLPASGAVPVGRTRVDLVGVDSTIHHLVKSRLAHQFADRYALVLQSSGPKLFVDGHEVHPSDPLREMLTGDEAPDGCGPRTFTFSDRPANQVGNAPVRGRLDTKITVGLAPQMSTKGANGARIYCNGRLVKSGFDIDLESGSDESSRVHPSSLAAWLIAIVEIRGRAEDMPWTSRKDALDPSARAYSELRLHLRQACTAFVDENLAAQRRLAKKILGGPSLPNVHDSIMLSYEQKIRSGKLVADRAREFIRDSDAFAKATARAKSPPIPEPPSTRDKGVSTLKDEIPDDRYRKLKALVESSTGEEDASGAFIVRALVAHYLECMSNASKH